MTRYVISPPDADAQTKINVRGNDAIQYIEELRNFTNDIGKAITARRAELAKRARDNSVHLAMLRDLTGDLAYLQGEWDCAYELYGTALGAITYRTDLDLTMIHRLVWQTIMERFMVIASDDSTSGYGNDDRRRIREGWRKTIERIKWIDQVPSLRFPKFEEHSA